MINHSDKNLIGNVRKRKQSFDLEYLEESEELKEDLAEEFVPIALRGLHESLIKPDYLGKMDLKCPSFNKCCKEGRRSLPPLQEPPEVLRKLYDFTDKEHAEEFHQQIRPLNMAFSFASIGEKGLFKCDPAHFPFGKPTEHWVQ